MLLWINEKGHKMSVNLSIPKNADPILQILYGKVEGVLDKSELDQDYHYLLERNHKIKPEDRKTYNYVCKRFREKLGLEAAALAPKPLLSPRVEVIKEVPIPIPPPPSLPIIDPSAYKIEFCYSNITQSDCSGISRKESHKETYQFENGDIFFYTWYIKNNGKLPLPAYCTLKPSHSNNLDANPDHSRRYISIEVLPSEGEIFFGIFMRAPDAPGKYFDYFRILLPTGQEIGPLLQCQIEVKKQHQTQLIQKPENKNRVSTKLDQTVLTAKDFVQIDSKTWKADKWLVKKTKEFWLIGDNFAVQISLPDFRWNNLHLIFSELPRSSRFIKPH